MVTRRPPPDTVWDRPEPVHRPRPEPLSREQIVRAAIVIADAQGLEAVSLRSVGAALDAGPMRLYRFIATKEELLDLMVDDVFREIATDDLARGKWRDALRTLANRTRKAAHRHPWFVDLLGGRPHLGPHALEVFEASLASMSRAKGFGDIDDALDAIKIFNAFVLGAIRNEASDAASGMDRASWQGATWPYIEKRIATGKFPMLERVVRDARHRSADDVFDEGIECVLDGIAERLAARKK